jgi:hypothetical protein
MLDNFRSLDALHYIQPLRGNPAELGRYTHSSMSCHPVGCTLPFTSGFEPLVNDCGANLPMARQRACRVSMILIESRCSRDSGQPRLRRQDYVPMGWARRAKELGCGTCV